VLAEQALEQDGLLAVAAEPVELVDEDERRRRFFRQKLIISQKPGRLSAGA
jgi:hypothetical protein